MDKYLSSLLLEELKKHKRICLTGSLGSGKTQMALDLALEFATDKNVDFIALNISTTYEDLVFGTKIETHKHGKLSLVEESKHLINYIENASAINTPYVIILENIGNVDLYEVFGDAIGILKGESSINLNNGMHIRIPNNLYFIATYNPLYGTRNQNNNNLFYTYNMNELEAKSFLETTSLLNNSEAPLSSEQKFILNKLHRYEEINNLIKKHLLDSENYHLYAIGWYYFNVTDSQWKLNQIIQHQLIPILNEYINTGILSHQAQVKVDGLVIYDHYVDEYQRIFDYDVRLPGEPLKGKAKEKEELLADKPFSYFVAQYWEGNSRKPYSTAESIFCLVYQLIDLKLIPFRELFHKMLYNSAFYEYKEYKANLFCESNNATSDYRSGYGTLLINGVKYSIVQRHAYHNDRINIEEFTTNNHQPSNNVFPDSNYGKAKRESNTINQMTFNILKKYYGLYLSNLKKLGTTNSELLYNRFYQEWNSFEQEVIQLNNSTCLDFNKFSTNLNEIRQFYYTKFLKIIDDHLSLLKMKIGESITLEDGTQITLKGAYSMENQSYFNTMGQLKIRQMILQGPPGTSKTHAAMELIKNRIIEKNKLDKNGHQFEIEMNKYLEESKFKSKLVKIENGTSSNKGVNYNHGVCWNIVQFHPSYTYEDFVRGIRVETNNNGMPDYSTVNKILGEMAEQADKDTSDTEYYLIVDEINRANLASVLGELIYGLEYRGNSVATPYKIDGQYELTIPENLYIIGTMNTADKSVGSIDYAIRRRFLFFDSLPSKDVLENEYEKNSEDEELPSVQLFNIIDKLFEYHTAKDYRKTDVQIGHTYFLTKKLLSENETEISVARRNILKSRFEYQIIPILREYYKDGILVERAIKSDSLNKEENEVTTNNNRLLFELIKYQSNKTCNKVFEVLLQGNEKGDDY